MTDARFPDRWLSDRRLQRLSDNHFRAFIHSLAWSVTNRTDGVIEPDDLLLIPGFPLDATKAFLAVQLWEPRGAAGPGWLITDFAATQTTALQLKAAERARAKEREKKARQRAAVRESTTSTDAVVPEDVPSDVPGDNTGKDRQGKDRHVVEATNLAELPLAAGGETWPAWRGRGPSPFEEHN